MLKGKKFPCGAMKAPSKKHFGIKDSQKGELAKAFKNLLFGA